MVGRSSVTRILVAVLVPPLLAGCVVAGAPASSGGAPGAASGAPAESIAPYASLPPTTAVAVSPGVAASSTPGRTASTATPQPTSAPTATAAPTAALHTITLADDGTTVGVRLGDSVLIDLGTGLTWTVTIANPETLSREIGVLVIVGAQGIYRAAQTGSTLVTAIGDPACRSSTPPCMAPSRSFSVTVVVH